MTSCDSLTFSRAITTNPHPHATINIEFTFIRAIRDMLAIWTFIKIAFNLYHHCATDFAYHDVTLPFAASIAQPITLTVLM